MSAASSSATATTTCTGRRRGGEHSLAAAGERLDRRLEDDGRDAAVGVGDDTAAGSARRVGTSTNCPRVRLGGTEPACTGSAATCTKPAGSSSAERGSSSPARTARGKGRPPHRPRSRGTGARRYVQPHVDGCEALRDPVDAPAARLRPKRPRPARLRRRRSLTRAPRRTEPRMCSKPRASWRSSHRGGRPRCGVDRVGPAGVADRECA